MFKSKVLHTWPDVVAARLCCHLGVSDSVICEELTVTVLCRAANAERHAIPPLLQTRDAALEAAATFDGAHDYAGVLHIREDLQVGEERIGAHLTSCHWHQQQHK